MRREAIRHSIWQTAELKLNLWYSGYSECFLGATDTKTSDNDEVYGHSSALRPEAKEFTPPCFLEVGLPCGDIFGSAGSVSIVKVDWDSCRFTLQERDLDCGGSLGKCPRLVQSDADTVPHRRLARETQAINREISLICPATPPVRACRLVTSIGLGMQPPARKTLRDTSVPDILQEVPVPLASSCTIVEDTTVMILSKVGDEDVWSPTRVYMHPVANKSLRGMDIRGIGENHPLCDKPMMLEGRAMVMEVARTKLKIKGMARIEENGSLYRVVGWLDK